MITSIIAILIYQHVQNILHQLMHWIIIDKLFLIYHTTIIKYCCQNYITSTIFLLDSIILIFIIITINNRINVSIAAIILLGNKIDLINQLYITSIIHSCHMAIILFGNSHTHDMIHVQNI